MKTLKSAIAIALILIFACALAWAEEPALTRDVKILFTGDVHCAIDQGWGYGGIYAVKQNLSQDVTIQSLTE